MTTIGQPGQFVDHRKLLHLLKPIKNGKPLCVIAEHLNTTDDFSELIPYRSPANVDGNSMTLRVMHEYMGISGLSVFHHSRQRTPLLAKALAGRINVLQDAVSAGG